jgi:hypothetical protein
LGERVRFRRIAPVVVLAAATGLAGFQSAPAHAATGIGLPLNNAYQVVADTAHGHVFISQGPGTGDGAGTALPIVVTNLSGTEVATIGDGAWGMALSPDDQTLYAATGDTVTAFSTATLQPTATYQAPGQTYGVAIQSGRLWVTYQSAGWDLVGGINLADPQAPWDSVPAQRYDKPPAAISADPSDGGTLVVSGDAVAGGPATATYNVSDPSAVTQIASSTSLTCGSADLSVLPGGATFLCAGYPYSTATLAGESTSANPGIGATAVTSDGTIAAMGDEFVEVLPAVGAEPTATYVKWWGLLPPSFGADNAIPESIGWSASGQQLFAVVLSTNAHGDNAYSLLTLSPFTTVPAPVTLTSSAASVAYGGSATITGHIGYTSSNRALAIYETQAGEAKKLIWSGVNDQPGTVTLRVALTRDTTFTEVYTGDAQYQPATISVAVKVAAKVATSLSGYYKTAIVSGLDYHFYHRNATLRDLVTVTPDKQGECARLEAQHAVKGVWHPDTITGCVALNKWSQTAFERKLTATGWFRVRADFTPSARDTANVGADSGWLYYMVQS